MWMLTTNPIFESLSYITSPRTQQKHSVCNSKTSPINTQKNASKGVVVKAKGNDGESQVELASRKTYLGEDYKHFEGRKVSEISERKNGKEGGRIKVEALNHIAIPVDDVEKNAKFYIELLGFEPLPRPSFVFDGAWLKGGGVTLHLIARDPSVPFASKGKWAKEYTAKPEPWYERRGKHLAFQVNDISSAERKLKDASIMYDKFWIPDTDAVQLFLFDPSGNVIEIGNYDALQKRKS